MTYKITWMHMKYLFQNTYAFILVHVNCPKTRTFTGTQITILIVFIMKAKENLIEKNLMILYLQLLILLLLLLLSIKDNAAISFSP